MSPMPPAAPTATRRSVLRALAVGSTALLAGCQAPAAGREGPVPTSTDTPTVTPPPDDPTAVEHVDVGERVGEVNPYSLEIWNDAAAERTVAVRVVDLTAGETPYEASVALPANGSLEISLRTPHDYRVEVDLPAASRHRTVQVTEREFDTCNEYRTQVALRDDAVDVQTIRTELLCRTATEA